MQNDSPAPWHSWESPCHLGSALRDRFLARPNAPHSACGALQKEHQKTDVQILLQCSSAC